MLSEPDFGLEACGLGTELTPNLDTISFFNFVGQHFLSLYLAL